MNQFFTPELVSTIVNALFGLALACATPALLMLFNKLHVDRNSKLGIVVEQAVQMAIRYAFSKLPGVSFTQALTDEKAKGDLIDLASSYVDTFIPDSLKKLGLNTKSIESLIESRLTLVIAKLAAEHTVVAAIDPLGNAGTNIAMLKAGRSS